MSRLPDGINLRLDTYLMVSNAVSVDNKWHIPNITDHSVTYICNSFDVKNWSHRCTIAANVAEHADLQNRQIAGFGGERQRQNRLQFIPKIILGCFPHAGWGNN